MLNRIAGPIVKRLPISSRLERIWKLAQLEFNKRYYNNKLGIIWALLNPLFRVCVYYFVFSLVFKKIVEGVPNYALVLFGGLVIWFSFAETVKKCMKILVSKSYLLESIQVNKIDLYLSATFSTLMAFGFNISAFFLASIVLGVSFSFYLFWLIPILMNVYLIAVGAGMILSVIYIYLKDIEHVLDILLLFGLWSSGIFYDGRIFESVFPEFLFINPFLGIILNFKDVALYAKAPDFTLLMFSMLFGIVIYLIGALVVKYYSSSALEKM